MEKEIQVITEKILKRETRTLLKEIDYFMAEDQAGGLFIINKGNGQAIGEKKEKRKVPGRKQFEILMKAAGEAACIEELLLYLSYQKSKDSGWNAKCRDGEDVAKKLAKSFMKIQDEIYKMIEQKAGADKINSEDERLIRLQIAEKYMGYLFWKVSTVSRS